MIRCRRRGFTLIELLVVVTLMTVTVGLAVTRLDGFSDTARLRSCAAQCSSVMKLALSEAKATGQPRLIRFVANSSMVSVHRPKRAAGSWEWDEGLEYRTGGAQIDRLLVEGADSPQTSLRFHAGRGLHHAIVLKASNRFAVLLCSPWGQTRFVPCERQPQALSFEVLLAELETIGAR